MDLNRYSEPMNAALFSVDPEDCFKKDAIEVKAQDLRRYAVRRYTSEELADLLTSTGFQVVASYGVMCITESRKEETMETDKSRNSGTLHDEFFDAVRSRDEHLALDLLNRDPSIANAKREIEMPGHMGEKPFTSLIAATDQDMNRLADALIKAGANIASQYGQHGGTALHFAAWHGHSKLVRLLIDSGAKIEIRCEDWDSTPLGWAVHGSSPNAWTSIRDQVGAAKMLIEAGARVELDGFMGMRPHEDMVMLLEKTAI